MKKYSIFDLDGTLLDSMWAWNDLGKDYLSQNGVTPPGNLNEVIAHMSMLETAEYFQKTYNIDLPADNIIEEIKKTIEYRYMHDLVLKPYVSEYLQKLENEQNIMCIATASPLKLALAALERNNILKYFSFVLSCDEVGVGKNKPDIFYLAANKLNAKPSEIAVYEDADFALITAKEEGFFTIGVYDEFFKSKQNDIQTISDIYIESFKELL